MDDFFGYIWIAIKSILFGGVIALQPQSATLTPKTQIFKAPPDLRLEAINDLASLHLRTNRLEQMTSDQIVMGDYRKVAERLSLTSINAFLVSDGKKICQLRFVGVGMTSTYNDAIYRCDTVHIAGMQFTGILMSSPHPIQIKAVRWQNVGK